MNIWGGFKNNAVPFVIRPDDEDIHILFLRNEEGSDTEGHVLLALGNRILSYAHHTDSPIYDHAFSADGLLIIADRTRFLESRRIPGEILVDYAFHADYPTMKTILNAMDAITEEADEWHCKGESEPDADDFASKLYQDTHCLFFNPTGRFARYNVWRRSSVTFVNQLMKNAIPGYTSFLQTTASYLAFLETKDLKRTVLYQTEEAGMISETADAK